MPDDIAPPEPSSPHPPALSPQEALPPLTAEPPPAAAVDDVVPPTEQAEPEEWPALAAIPPAVLVQLNGPEDGYGTLVTISGAQIGRNEPDLILDLIGDPWVSRLHARLEYRDESWWLVDNGSKNGTWLDRTQVTDPIPLRPGQIFRVGHSELLFSDDPTLATQVTHNI